MGKEVYTCPAAFHPGEYRWTPISSCKLTQASIACSRTTWVEKLWSQLCCATLTQTGKVREQSGVLAATYPILRQVSGVNEQLF